jgi:hypothetical protein
VQFPFLDPSRAVISRKNSRLIQTPNSKSKRNKKARETKQRNNMVQAIRLALVAAAAILSVASAEEPANDSRDLLSLAPPQAKWKASMKPLTRMRGHRETIKNGKTLLRTELNPTTNKFESNIALKWRYQNLKPNTPYTIHMGNADATCKHFEVSESEFELDFSTDHFGKAKGEVFFFDKHQDLEDVQFQNLAKRSVAIVNGKGNIVSCGELELKSKPVQPPHTEIPKITCANVRCSGDNTKCYDTHVGPLCIGPHNARHF